MTKPVGLFGRLALRLLAPDPFEAPLTTLAKSQPVVPIDKSWWKLGGYFAMIIFTFAGLALCVWWSESIVAALFFSIILFLPLFAALLPLRIATCRQPPLVLEPEGLRVNFTGDFIRYDQIRDVEFLSLSAGMHLRLVSGVTLKSGRAHLVIAPLYIVSIFDLVGEIKRRMKAARTS